MADEPPEHQAVVHEWLQQANGASPTRMLDLFEAGFQRMWQRAQPTLGELTLGAIVDRVLYTATERFPFLAALRIKSGSLDFTDLRDGLDAVSPDELARAAPFVIVEFLTVLGHLTAEILTPALHAELSEERPAKGSKPRARGRTKT